MQQNKFGTYILSHAADSRALRLWLQQLTSGGRSGLPRTMHNLCQSGHLQQYNYSLFNRRDQISCTALTIKTSSIFVQPIFQPRHEGQVNLCTFQDINYWYNNFTPSTLAQSTADLE